MNVHEIHPEELLDKAERGTLTSSERESLDRHLASCAVCRLEIMAREDFRMQEQEIFAEGELDAIIGASLRGAEMPKKQAPQRSKRAAGWGPRRWALLVAAAMLLLSAQATARWLGWHAPTWLVAPKEDIVTPHVSARDSDDTHASKAPPLVVSHPVAVTTAPTPPDPPQTAPTALAVPRAPAPAVSTSVPTPSSSALFSQANADREMGKHVVAADEYRRLLGAYPTAPEAELARATLGRLLLDDGDAASALPLFDAYLAKGGPLREETMVNRAIALERLHRESDEAAEWRALLDAYPKSMNAEHARARLEELDAR